MTKDLGLMAPGAPYDTQINSWRVHESLAPHPQQDLRQKGIGVYSLLLEREVSTQDEVWSALDEASKLSEELDIAWCYAWGKPYRSVETMLRCIEAPEGWSGNLREVERNIERKKGGFFVDAAGFAYQHYAWWPCLPLERAVAARRACTKAPPVIRELIELHIRWHKSVDRELFLLAKALEIVGAYFGKSRADRNAGIEQEMKKLGVNVHLTQTAAWLFDIANERFDVRHAWDKDSPGVVLHPRMTDQEKRDFMFNADLIVRVFICEQLGIDVCIITHYDGEPKQFGRWEGDTLVFAS
jgi:hypothetical protein